MGGRHFESSLLHVPVEGTNTHRRPATYLTFEVVDGDNETHGPTKQINVRHAPIHPQHQQGKPASNLSRFNSGGVVKALILILYQEFDFQQRCLTIGFLVILFISFSSVP